MARAVEQIKTQHRLKFRNLTADRTGGNAKLSYGGCHALVTRNGLEGTQRIQGYS